MYKEGSAVSLFVREVSCQTTIEKVVIEISRAI